MQNIKCLQESINKILPPDTLQKTELLYCDDKSIPDHKIQCTGRHRSHLKHSAKHIACSVHWLVTSCVIVKYNDVVPVYRYFQMNVKCKIHLAQERGKWRALEKTDDYLGNTKAHFLTK